jgi:dTDP-4-amino-4,6-dideoxygalactose transaminase
LFEKSIEEWLRVPYARAVCNGSAAIKAALLAVGVKTGDFVITTPFTFVATGNAIIQIGARPLFVDINPTSLTISCERIREAISYSLEPHTQTVSAILPVHIFGRSCDIDGLAAIRDEFKIPIVEDACQAIGATYPTWTAIDDKGVVALREHYLGTFFDAGCLSFYGSKNLWTYEGGMVLTPRSETAKKIEQLRNHGLSYDQMVTMGYNWKMGWINAFQGWQMVKMHKKAIMSELGLFGPKDGYYSKLVYNHPWYQNFENKGAWFAMDCPNAERAAEKVAQGWR